MLEAHPQPQVAFFFLALNHTYGSVTTSIKGWVAASGNEVIECGADPGDLLVMKEKSR
jgi:hypothetical protein